MIAARFIPLILKQAVRHRTRTALTVCGVAAAMFLFCGVQALQRGVAEATTASRADSTLVVYRENRFCPFTSRLPDHYRARIAGIDGVASVVPMKIVVNNCRAGLDVVTFRGVPEEDFRPLAREFALLDGSLDAWGQRSDAALIGESLARRRRLKAGDSFDAAGITVHVAGVMRSDAPQDQNVAYVHLDFLQRSAARGGDGIVTQFNVRVSDPDRSQEVADAIDAEFRSDSEPTRTRPEKSFVAQAAADIVAIVEFTRWLGWACIAAVLALVCNAIVLSVQDRVKEHAILQTLGFRSGLIARLIVGESLLLSLAGGALGAGAALLAVRVGRYSISVDGVSLNISADPRVAAFGLLLAAALGVVAGLVPALRASRREIASCFRAI